MGRFFRRLWRYLGAAGNKKLDEKADPKVQIEQAIEEAQRRHQALSQQAAAVLGNRRQLELKLGRQMEEVEKLQSSARQALVLADKAKADGDTAKAGQYEHTAQAFATQLINAESSMQDTKALHDQALTSSDAAKKAVEQNAQQLQGQLAERSKLLTQLEHVKMQEQMNAALTQVSELSAPGDTPSLNEVRDRIEQRYGMAMGQQELTNNSVQARMLEVQQASVDGAASMRLEQIRAGLGGGATPAVEAASQPASLGAGSPDVGKINTEKAAQTAPPQGA